jgi:hypothetical protein
MHLLLHFHLLLIMVELLGAARVVTGRTHWTRRTRLHYLFHLLLPVLLRRIRTPHSLRRNWTSIPLRYGGSSMVIIYVSHGRVAIVIFTRTHATYWRVHLRNRTPRRWHPLRWGDDRIMSLTA